MRSNNFRVYKGVIYSFISFSFSICIAFYSYRFLWNHADKIFFSVWLALFEFSQFLLLLDIGFTHGFIKKMSQQNSKKIIDGLPSLRGTLSKVGFLGFLIVVVVGFISGHQENIGIIPIILLGLSVFLTLICYADTAGLRLNEKFKDIYLINTLGNIMYLFIIICIPFKDAIFAVALATFLRSLMYLLSQNFLLGSGFKISFKSENNSDYNVIYLNFSYFILFMLDALIMTFLKVSPVTIAAVVIFRKYYDTLRGAFDSAMSVLSIAFAKKNDQFRDILIFSLVIVGFFSAFICSEYIIYIWLGGFKYDFSISLAIAFSAMSLTLFRLESTKMFFQNYDGMIILVFSAILIKLVFLILLKFYSVTIAYLVQGLILMLFSFFMLIVHKKSKSVMES
jgi:hypothetical protein